MQNTGLLSASTKYTNEIDRSIAIGKLPYGQAYPPVFTCGHCRLTVIPAGVGICKRCKEMLERRSDESLESGKPRIAFGLIAITAVIIAACWLFGPWATAEGGHKKAGGRSEAVPVRAVSH